MERVRPVRIGLVGYGTGGRFFHAPLIAEVAGCELTGVVTRSAEQRGDLERDHPGTPTYDDLAQLASAGEDAVAISAPADAHVPLVLELVTPAFACPDPSRSRSVTLGPRSGSRRVRTGAGRDRKPSWKLALRGRSRQRERSTARHQ